MIPPELRDLLNNASILELITMLREAEVVQDVDTKQAVLQELKLREQRK